MDVCMSSQFPNCQAAGMGCGPVGDWPESTAGEGCCSCLWDLLAVHSLCLLHLCEASIAEVSRQ